MPIFTVAPTCFLPTRYVFLIFWRQAQDWISKEFASESIAGVAANVRIIHNIIAFNTILTWFKARGALCNTRIDAQLMRFLSGLTG